MTCTNVFYEQNYHWWWRSFVVSGGSAFYVLAYSVYYYTKVSLTHINSSTYTYDSYF